MISHLEGQNYIFFLKSLSLLWAEQNMGPDNYIFGILLQIWLIKINIYVSSWLVASTHDEKYSELGLSSQNYKGYFCQRN